VTSVPEGPWALVLEDDPSVTAVLESCLARLGWPSVASADWEAGRGLLAAEGCVLLIADQGLSDSFTGAAAIAWARANLPDIRCLLVSGSTRPPRFRDELPYQAFLDKPFGPKELEEALQRLGLPPREPLPRRRYTCPST
jgi:CheY-like chemotaxis protein